MFHTIAFDEKLLRVKQLQSTAHLDTKYIYNRKLELFSWCRMVLKRCVLFLLWGFWHGLTEDDKHAIRTSSVVWQTKQNVPKFHLSFSFILLLLALTKSNRPREIATVPQ